MSEPRRFLLPDLGEGLTEAEVVRWLVAVGEVVAIDQPVVEVETAKAAVEVPTPYGGVVAELHGVEGTVLAVGTPLISIADPTGSPAPQTSARPGFTEPGVVTADGTDPDEAGESGSVLVGYGTAANRRTGRRRVGVPAQRATAGPPARDRATVPSAGRVRVPVSSPVVRLLAKRHGIDVRAVSGSGANGLVMRRDIEAAIAAQAAESVSPAARPSAAPLSPGASDGIGGANAAGGTERRIPLRGMRRAVAEQMARSRREIPEATVWVDVDATEFLRVRSEINAATPDRPVSLLGLLTRFCVLGLTRFPELNSTVDTERNEVVVHSAINVGFAAQTDRGLLVPVLRDAGSASARQLSERIGALTGSARAGSLSPADLTGGTFTINNYGVFGVDGSAAIINHPEAAILGIGRIIDRPWVVDGQLTVRKVTELTLAFDHRVCDGRVAGGFLRFVADCLERPTLLLAD